MKLAEISGTKIGNAWKKEKINSDFALYNKEMKMCEH